MLTREDPIPPNITKDPLLSGLYTKAMSIAYHFFFLYTWFLENISPFTSRKYSPQTLKVR